MTDPSPPTAKQWKPDTSALGWLGASTLVVLILCLPASLRQGLWTDELFSLVAARDRPSIFLRLLWDLHPPYYDQPPLYFLLLHPFTWAGESAIALRIPSVFFGIAALTSACLMARRVGLSLFMTSALLILLATQPTTRFQCTNVRMYSLFLFENVLLALSLVRIAFSGNARWRDILIGGFALGAMFYTSFHSTVIAAGITSICFLFLLVPASLRKRGLIRARPTGIALFKLLAIAALVGSGWFLPTLQKRIIFGASDFIYPDSLLTQVIQVTRAMFGGIWTQLILLAGILSFGLLGKNRIILGILSLGCVLIPSFLAVVLTPPDHFIADRYFIHVPIWIFLISGLGWQSLADRLIPKFKIARVATLLLFISPAVSFYIQMQTTLFKPFPDWHAAAVILQSNALPEEGILTGGFMSGEAIEFEMPDSHPFTFHHKVYDLAPFRRMARKENVIWHINAGPLPPEFIAIIKEEFPYYAAFEGRNLAQIEIHAKKPFTLPWGAESQYHPIQKKKE